MREYFDRSSLAPYLQAPLSADQVGLSNEEEAEPSSADARSVTQSPNGEADAAAGSMLQRVSSFSLLGGSGNTPRSSTKKTLRRTPQTPPQREPPQPKEASEEVEEKTVVPTWRLKDRMRTVGVGLVMALNVGTDPPDVTKPHPCAKLQCWMDPAKYSRARAREAIGERLEAQYSNWQQQRAKLKYRRALDPTVDEVRALCLWLRRQARTERILLHYNGHGVPRPTANGEIWVFDRNHTQYIPLSVTDLRQWMGKPSIVVLDCSSAGVLMPFLTSPVDAGANETTPSMEPASPLNGPSGLSWNKDIDAAAAEWVRDTIVLCPTSDQELLPMNPEYPADIFTACLTTPIQMALRWFVRRNPQSMGGLLPEAVDAIPGKANDRKTPLGELNWIFTAVTDSIAWNALPKPLFSRLFRQDLLVASMFRNFLLADRILRSLNCTPQSYPPLPPGVCDHPLWQAWDLACETCLYGLIRDGVLGNHVLTPLGTPVSDIGDDGTPRSSPTSSPKLVPKGPPKERRPTGNAATPSVSSPFFSEQLTAFEVWLEFASIHKQALPGLRSMEPYESPEQLPVVLQVLLSQAHRIRALELLRRFLDLGPWAVNLALSLGIFPYVMKLLRSPEYKHVLVGIWAKILAFDPSCQVDLVKDGSVPHFIHHLSWGLNEATAEMASNYNDAAEQRTMAAFILSVTCLDYSRGQTECLRQNILGACCALLSSAESGENGELDSGVQAVATNFPPTFRLWLCICIGNAVKDNNAAQTEAYGSAVHISLFSSLKDACPDVRAAACYSLGCLIGYSSGQKSTGEEDVAAGQHPASSAAVTMGQPQGLQVAGSSMQHTLVVPRLLCPSGQPLVGVPAARNLRPTFAPANIAGAPSMPWHPQQVREGALSYPQPILQSQPFAAQPTPYSPGMVQPHIQGGRHQGGHSYPVQGQPALLSPQYSHVPSEPLQQAPSVFEDHTRLAFDLAAMEYLVQAAGDASPLVRYEAIISLACAVGKYLPAFTAVAEGVASSPKPDESKEDGRKQSEQDGLISSRQPSVIQLPSGVDNVFADKFSSIWKTLISLQRNDLYPAVSHEANAVVSVVHEHILMEISSKASERDVQNLSRTSLGNETGTLPTGASIGRNKSDLELAGILPSISGRVNSGGTQQYPAVSGNAIINENESMPLPVQSPTQVPGLRRVSSEHLSKLREVNDVSSPSTLRSHQEAAGMTFGYQAQFKVQYILPKSKFYAWKRDAFAQGSSVIDDGAEEVDALSPEGALHAYRERRNAQVHDLSNRLAERYASLAPKPPQPRRRGLDPDLIFDDPAAIAAEEEAASRKSELKLRQSALLTSDGASSLRFHPYEEALVVSDDGDGISVWNLKDSTLATTFRNGNPKKSRMTSASWINQMSSSAFLVGCDDGSVRIWDGLIESDGQINTEHPSLSSAFFAAPDLVAGASGSGLITDWQQFSGKLIAGGNSKLLRCWDLGAEKCVSTHETNSAACITTLTTAWEYDPYGEAQEPEGYYGVSPDLVVAGCRDGCLKVFDIRSTNQAAQLGNDKGSSRSRSRRRERFTNYKEHNSWIVNTSFTSFGGRYEIVSGSTAGDIKIWDLRMSSSLRTIEVQRSLMTALSIHSKIPIVAAGSKTQFIKILTLDGDTLQVIRYHEKKPGHRIGPVSCLEFHPHRPLLASATRDNVVSIYCPTRPIL